MLCYWEFPIWLLSVAFTCKKKVKASRTMVLVLTPCLFARCSIASLVSRSVTTVQLVFSFMILRLVIASPLWHP